MAATILCVEDEEDLRKDIVEELREAGYDLLEAENGKVALETIIDKKPDLVLCDISMPVMGGYELLEEIKANHPERCDLPFVFLTALADRSHVVMGKKLGADDYLTKPVDYELLLAAVEARLDHAERVKARHKDQLVKVYKAAVEELTHAADSDGATQGRSLQEHLQELIADSPTKVVAGRVHLVGLDDVKAALGDRWTRRSDVIYDLIERTIRAKLAPADVYQRDSAGNFTICFASLSEAEAAFKARAIADEIRGKVLGMDFEHNAQPLSAEDRDFLQEVVKDRGKGQGFGVEGEAHEVEVSADDVQEGTDILDLLTSRLTAAAALSKKTERSVLVEMVDKARLELHSCETQKGDVTPFQFATLDRDSQELGEALRNNRPASHELVRDLDILLLTKVAEEILQRPPGRNAVMVVNVHFSTLDNKHRLEHFKKVCDTLTDTARAALIFNIVEIPANLLPAKVAEHFFLVRHYCRAMMAQCHAPGLGNLDPQMLRTPILTYDATDFVKALTRSPHEIFAFFKLLAQRKVRLLVHGITGELQRAKVRATGVDFLTRD